MIVAPCSAWRDDLRSECFALFLPAWIAWLNRRVLVDLAEQDGWRLRLINSCEARAKLVS